MEQKEGADVELFVRSLAPQGAQTSQEQLLERVSDLVDRGIIGEYTVHVCGRRAPAMPGAADSEFGEYLVNRVAVFRQWARRNEFALDSVFQERTIESGITGESRRELVLPLFALAEYETDSLRFVAPVRDGEECITVEERLDHLKSGEGPDVEPVPRARAEPPEEERLVR